ncbi:hypothetical protein [Chitinophaga pinensis]|uniref:Uncharacterized protein n=1 Tax=Chitinophaga pinensis (strain ATCC 43595 / DSM 2588 / LMG 13176 / NBRC 15968 / NCIMB 11800 / UQM 2034) TaxID=485918 RepID=A0A979G175_CHIPD|nr:hypothetical protein [Chitinophaga pinensis]ACU58883.1 hypothetical protein Cpin_1386 [Chitinophaga pinensis DSM 2588]
MKLNVYPVILVLIASLLISCKKDMEFGDDYSKSEKAWNGFKAYSGNSYRYMVATASWAGTASETIMTVKDGHVIARSYVQKERIPGSPDFVTRTQWEEDAASLGSHTAGAGLFTLDDIYSSAKNDWLKKRDNAKTYFEANNHGMISSCGYVEDGCADDCFRGISIGFIETL